MDREGCPEGLDSQAVTDCSPSLLALPKTKDSPTQKLMIGTDANASCAMIDCAYGCEEKSEKEENSGGEKGVPQASDAEEECTEASAKSEESRPEEKSDKEESRKKESGQSEAGCAKGEQA